MGSLNKCSFIGNLASNPEVRYTASGKPVANFRIGVNEKYKDSQGNNNQKTQWVPIVLWNKLAEISQKYLSKGSLIFIEGKWSTRQWEDKEGNKRYTTEVVGRELVFLGSRDDTQDQGQTQNQGQGQSQQPRNNGRQQNRPPQQQSMDGQGYGYDQGYPVDDDDYPF